MRNSRPLVWILGGVAVAGVLVWLVLAPGASDRRAPSETHAPPGDVQTPAAQREPAPALPPEPAPDDEHAQEHLEHHDDFGPGELAEDPAALPEPPSEDDVAARPERQPITPEEQRAQRQASIDLLERHIQRLEAEQKAAEASGDTRTADRNRIRVERMRQRRATLEAEAAAERASP
ncbi:MAG TPA: hypothetical protein VNM90_09570 [Haliangium sp.]|nr:hypothetical protein [Haliangium sp.]